MPAPPRDRAALADAALLGAGLLLMFVVLPHGLPGDGWRRFEGLATIVEHGRVPGEKWPLIGSLFALPLYLLGKLVVDPAWWVARFNVLVVAAGLLLLHRQLRDVLEPAVLRAFLLLLALGSYLTPLLMGFGAEAFNAVAVGAGLAAWVGGRHWLGGALLAFGAANMPATLPGLAAALLFWAWRHKQARALWPLLAAAALVGAENLIRHGSILAHGYGGPDERGFRTVLPYSGRPGFSYPLAFGVLSLIFSFGRGILFFTPGLFLPFRGGWRALEPVRELLAGYALYLAGLLAVYGQWWAWYGGDTYGPRFLTFAAVPASLILAAHVRAVQRELVPILAVLAVLALSVWVAASAEAFNGWGLGICSRDAYRLEFLCWYVPEFSALWAPSTLAKPLGAREIGLLAFCGALYAHLAAPLARAALELGADGARKSWAAWRARPPWRW